MVASSGDFRLSPPASFESERALGGRGSRQVLVSRSSGREDSRRVPASLQRLGEPAYRTRGFLVPLVWKELGPGNQPFREHFPPLPNPSPTRGGELEMRAAPVLRSPRRAVPQIMSRRPNTPPPAWGRGRGRGGDARRGIHLPPQAALAALGLGRTSAVAAADYCPPTLAYMREGLEPPGGANFSASPLRGASAPAWPAACSAPRTVRPWPAWRPAGSRPAR